MDNITNQLPMIRICESTLRKLGLCVTVVEQQWPTTRDEVKKQFDLFSSVRMNKNKEAHGESVHDGSAARSLPGGKKAKAKGKREESAKTSSAQLGINLKQPQRVEEQYQTKAAPLNKRRETCNIIIQNWFNGARRWEKTLTAFTRGGCKIQ